MRRLATLRVRVVLASGIVVGLGLAAGGAWLVNAQRNSLAGSVETAAVLRSRDIAASIAGGVVPSTLAAPPGDENLAQVVDARGRVDAASANISGEARISTVQPGSGGSAIRTFQTLPVAEGPFRVVVQRVRTRAGVFLVYVAGSLDSVTTSAHSLARLLLFALPVLLLLVGVTTWVVVGRALRPVESIRREVEAIGAGDLHRRVPEPSSADEVGRLARTMNAMLGRLEQATERQRRFVADASHELRSPLTGIRAQLEVDLARPQDADWQSTERDVLVDAIRLQRLVDDLLVLAVTDESSFDPSTREPVDLDEIVLGEARRLRSRSARVVETTRVSGAQLMGNRDQLTRAVRNLLDNAARHATSTVTASLAETETAVVLVVVDDGPGVPVDQQGQIFERFTRLDDARDRDRGGTGLGLAITEEVVAAHGGTITVDNVPGAQFTVSFPLVGELRDPQ